MIPYERHERILEHLKENGVVKIADLQNELPGVSISTLRRDLKVLESWGKIEHLSGGAVKPLVAAHEINISTRSAQRGVEKETIARLAAAEVEDGDVVYVDSGSTCATLLRLLLDRNITIYTTDCSACFIQDDFSAKLTIVGGDYSPVTSSLTGSLTELILREIYFDKAFIGSNAIDEERGVMTPGYLEASKKRIVHENSGQTYVLCDSSKFHEVSNVRALGFDGIVLISDKADEKLRRVVRMITP